MKQYIDMDYNDLMLLPIWQVIKVGRYGEVTTVRDYLTGEKANKLAQRCSLAEVGIDVYDDAPMPQHDHHVMQWEVRQSAKRIIAQLEGMN